MNYTDIGILLVEDNAGDARLIREMLSATAYASAHFRSVGSLREARELPIDHASVAMVLLDLNLPDSSGMGTLSAIKEFYADSAIIVLTGLDDVELAIQALREGAQNYLTKDELNANHLGRTLRRSIERHAFVQRLRDADRAVQEQLRTSQALMAEAQRVGHIGSWFLSLETEYRQNAPVFWSDELFRIFGHEPGGFTPTLEYFIRAVHPEDRARVQETVQRVLRTLLPIAFEHRILRPDGTVRWLHEENSVIADPVTGRGIRIVGTAQDITDQKVAEEQVRASEERFRAMIEGSTDGITLTDPEGNILYTSPSILPMLGYTAEEMLGQPMSGILAKDKRPVLEELYRIIMERPGAVERMVFQLQHKDGSLRWVDGLFTNMLHMPAVRAVVTNYRDITDTVALQKQHAFAQSNLSAMINSTQDLVWSVDRDMRLIAANEPFVKALEYSVGGRMKPGDDLMMVPDTGGMSPTEHWRPLYQRALAGESFKVEEHMTAPVEAYMEMSYGPIHDQGSVVGVAAFSRDITAIRLAQLELERSHLEARTSELQKTSILDALPARVVLLNGEGIILEVNEAWRAFWKRSGRLGESCGIGEEYLPIARKTIGSTVFLGQHVSEGVTSVLNGLSEGFKMECGLPAEEPTSWFQLRAAPLSGQKGAVVVHTDVTELRLAKEEVMRWNTQLEDRVVERTTELLLANEELEEATEKNKRLGKEVAAQNKELMSSINYASGIQRSLFPERQEFGFFKDMGSLFRPRSVVSGDFLWCHGTAERFIVAVGDCTGHGVPGAMMSMLGHDLLNNIVGENNHSQPKEILFQLDQGVTRLFLRSEALNISDGMDMALVKVDKLTLQLTFAGAGLPAMILRNGESILLEGTKNPIGGSHEASSCKLFHERTCQLRPGDRICLFTDGYADQFGGPGRKKFFRRRFFELLSGLHPLPAAQAAEALDRHFTEWKGTQDQVDDVLVLLLDV
jgi:PAS domain S-box-containing protein